MIEPLPSARLTHRTDPARFAFATTAELEDVQELVGQPRAARAVELGVTIDRDRYHVYVMGPPGTGRHTLVDRVIAERAAKSARPSDWAYVNNFAEPHRPLALELPPGRGAELRDGMRALVEELKATIPAVFESEEYNGKVEAIDAEFRDRHERAFGALGTQATEQGIALLRTPAGFSFAPVKDGEVMSPDDFAKLSEDEQKRIEAAIVQLQSQLEHIVRDVLRWRKERLERIKHLNRDMALLAVGHVVDEMKRRYAGLDRVIAYLDAVQADVIESVDDFRKREAPTPILPGIARGEEPSMRRYEVNLLVDNGSGTGAPVVTADHPTYQNLVGRVDHIAQLGTLVTDFGLIKPGALHRANGGYLVIDAAKILWQPFAWEALKRALTRREVRIESLAEMYSLVSTVSLEPEPIPLRVKIILVGERLLYYLLQQYDPEFIQLFRIAADFADEFDRTPENELQYARLLATVARRDGLLPLGRDAVAAALDFGARLAGDGKKVSANLRRVVDMLGEADFLARQAARPAVAAEDVRAAIEAQRHRADRLRERLHETILRGTVMIDTAGAKVGQVNALSVFELGDFAFGEPTRVTATTRLGEGQVIDIQREAQLGGAIHSKGVLILSSFLAARFSLNRPHSLAASLAFEQTYGTVEGDSASVAELCALLSSLAEIPIRQSLAVTGSVNQLGEVQAIGGVNEKIEGFFDVCAARGLTGDQGVVIPAANVEHLMLRDDVVAACAQRKFAVYPVRTVDEAIELLTGVPAGAPDLASGLPAETVNARVARRLHEFAERRRGVAPERLPARRPPRGRRSDRG
jgi:lon-related putative ATP-dependent protease